MYRKTISGLLLILMASCGVVKKKTTYGQKREITIEASTDSSTAKEETTAPVKIARVPKKAEKVINTALGYSGTRYKYGGTTKKGMDCSGLLYVAFLEHKVSLPRVSYQMANEGSRINLDQVTKGDLLFFKTSKKSKKINHVGLVVAVDGDEIKFIHATSSRGVIVSSLREGYWNYAFVKATRIL